MIEKMFFDTDRRNYEILCLRTFSKMTYIELGKLYELTPTTIRAIVLKEIENYGLMLKEREGLYDK